MCQSFNVVSVFELQWYFRLTEITHAQTHYLSFTHTQHKRVKFWHLKQLNWISLLIVLFALLLTGINTECLLNRREIIIQLEIITLSELVGSLVGSGGVLFTLFIFSNLQHRDTGKKIWTYNFFFFTNLRKMLHFVSLFKLATQKLALKSRTICFSTSSPRSHSPPRMGPCGSWSPAVGCGGAAEPGSPAPSVRPQRMFTSPTTSEKLRHTILITMTDESPKTSSAGLEVRTGAAEPAGSEPRVRTGSRSSWTKRYITVTTRENTSLINCD